MARSNGKSWLAARLARDYLLDGAADSEVVLVASSYSQAKIIFRYAVRMVRESGRDPDDRRRWYLRDAANVALLRDKLTGRAIRALSCDPRRAHGRVFGMALLDEPAQWPRGSRDAMLAAIRTGTGKVSGSKVVALGTRPANPDHWFSQWLAGGADYSQVHAARPGDPPFWIKTARLANPSLPHLPALREAVEGQRRAARAGGGALAAYRALVLNLGTEDTARTCLVDFEDWERIERETLPPATGDYALGVDLGGGASMSAAAAYFPATGRLEGWALLPSLPSLRDRGRKDGVGDLYSLMEAEGTLRTAPLADMPSLLLDEAARRYGRPPAAISADRWRATELVEAAEAAGLDAGVRCDWRGQGFKDGGEDVRRFRARVLGGTVAAERSLLLRAAMREARTISDPAGNEKLSKMTEGGRRKNARDDVAAAAILAVSCADRLYRDPDEARPPRIVVVR